MSESIDITVKWEGNRNEEKAHRFDLNCFGEGM